MKLHGRNVFFYGAFTCLILFILFYRLDVNPKFGNTDWNEFSNIDRSKFMRIKEFIEHMNDEEKVTEEPKIDARCECKSERSGKSYDFCYKNPKNASLIGKRFDCSHLKTLEDLKILNAPEQTLVNVSDGARNESDVMFVSAISSNHFGNFKEMFALVKKHWPKQKMILYSLNLNDDQINQLEKEPNVDVKRFNYSIYPKYVENWMEYRFKAIILAEAIRDYPNVWWIDAHTRWKVPKPMEQFYGEVATCYNDVACEKKSSLMMFINSTHGNYAVLTKTLLDYFPTYDLDVLKTYDKGLQLSAMFVYLARTPFTLEILKWHTLCALEEKCMNPPGAKLKCDIIPRWDVYAGCFRYDQSSLNILMFNQFRDHNHYFMDVGVLDRTYAHY